MQTATPAVCQQTGSWCFRVHINLGREAGINYYDMHGTISNEEHDEYQLVRHRGIIFSKHRANSLKQGNQNNNYRIIILIPVCHAGFGRAPVEDYIDCVRDIIYLRFFTSVHIAGTTLTGSLT